jgi:hypothetical protein
MPGQLTILISAITQIFFSHSESRILTLLSPTGNGNERHTQ